VSRQEEASKRKPRVTLEILLQKRETGAGRSVQFPHFQFHHNRKLRRCYRIKGLPRNRGDGFGRGNGTGDCYNEIRYTALARMNASEADELPRMAQTVVTEKYHQYEALAARDGTRFHPDGERAIRFEIGSFPLPLTLTLCPSAAYWTGAWEPRSGG
jgi:hypothetical protein